MSKIEEAIEDVINGHLSGMVFSDLIINEVRDTWVGRTYRPMPTCDKSETCKWVKCPLFVLPILGCCILEKIARELARELAREFF